MASATTRSGRRALGAAVYGEHGRLSCAKATEKSALDGRSDVYVATIDVAVATYTSLLQ